ncbi:uncharacterized protein LOC6729602 [Drosophila simulans]|uniref:uncharacterized protein LOC6729602 n=1 Tax=Drosophila simulans TaxID=7240 RepID=UPI00078AE067|nr:uncharacterized protein LOC6729602 [Drosophila simulans]KMZ05834.1 uncharacterized protein Dsimw501_GD18208 [Drosophila simulans]
MTEETGTVPMPTWLKADLFEELLSKRYGGNYAGIKSFKPEAGLKPGENYSTIMLRLKFEVELKDHTIENVSYMLKTPHDFEMYREILKKNNMFAVERDVFIQVVPELEQMYKNVGLEVKFAAKAYEIDAPDDYVLLQDLGPLGFRNVDRLEGLDMVHTKSVLKKMAQWHAVSATRIHLKGPYAQNYLQPTYADTMKENIEQVAETLGKYFLKCLPLYEGYEEYSEAVHKMQPKIVDLMYAMNTPDPQDFNALNHGDCWTNNIMFKYEDESPEPIETYFVDLQLPKVTSVAYDLIYFLLGSTKFEIQLSQFDYFIKYYHDQLVEHLRLLNYPEAKTPTLRFLHTQLLKYGRVGYHIAFILCPPVLLDRTEDANLTDFVTETDNGDGLKMAMYSNARYKKHVSAILKWLNNRGAFQC